METTPPGHHGRHVRPHVVSALENVTEHVPTLSQCSEGDRVRSRAWVYQVKLSIATCDSVQVLFFLFGLRSWYSYQFSERSLTFGKVQVLYISLLGLHCLHGPIV